VHRLIGQFPEPSLDEIETPRLHASRRRPVSEQKKDSKKSAQFVRPDTDLVVDSFPYHLYVGSRDTVAPDRQSKS